jgi:hypothetical protein
MSGKQIKKKDEVPDFQGIPSLSCGPAGTRTLLINIIINAT